jgi:hypothetical protein
MKVYTIVTFAAVLGSLEISQREITPLRLPKSGDRTALPIPAPFTVLSWSAKFSNRKSRA